MATIDTHRASYTKVPNVKLGKNHKTITSKGLNADLRAFLDKLAKFEAENNIINKAALEDVRYYVTKAKAYTKHIAQ